MYQVTKNITLLVLLSSYSLLILADTVSRPSPNNKLGITKKTQEQKDNSFIKKIFKWDFDTLSINNYEDINRIKLEIKELKKQKVIHDDSINSNERILNQIKTLSNLKKEGILTESEFNNKKRLLLDKMK